MQAMILAAGFGTRLLPYTRFRPKPLFPILNTPLLLLTIRRLQGLGFTRIVVNAHHLREQIVAAVEGLAGVEVQEEESILGTGGGLRRALGALGDEPLLVTNGDIYHDIDVLEFYHRHRTCGMPVSLALRDDRRYNTVWVDNETIAGFDREQRGEQLAFTGLHVISPEILEDIEDGVYSCIIAHYRQLLRKGVGLHCYRCDHNFWTDMGTPEDYLALHGGLLSGTIPWWRELGEKTGCFVVNSGARLAEGVELEDWVCIGAATIGSHTTLRRVVVWDGAAPLAQSVYQDVLLYGGGETVPDDD